MSTEQTSTDPDEASAAEPVPLDQEPQPRQTAFDRITAHREGAKQPVLPEWVREAEQREPILGWAASYAWHVFLFTWSGSRSTNGGWRTGRRWASGGRCGRSWTGSPTPGPARCGSRRSSVTT